MSNARLTIALAAMAFANDAIAQTSTCMDMGGGMTHCDTMGTNGSTSSTNCQAMGGSMATCNTMGMNPPQRSYPTPDMSQPQNNGSTLSFIGSLVARSQERSFQKKLGAMISSGDCEGAATLAFSKGRTDASEWVRSACHPKAAVEMPDGYTDADIAAMLARKSSQSAPASSAASLPITPAPMTLVSDEPAPSDASGPVMEATDDEISVYTAQYNAWKQAGGNKNKQIVQPNLNGTPLDTVYTVKYVGHNFSIIGPRWSSIDELRTRFDDLWKIDPWEKITTGSAGSVYFFDVKSVKLFEDHVEVWIKVDRSKDNSTKIRSTMEFDRFICGTGTMQVMQSANYDAQGRVISSYDSPAQAFRVIPETIGNVLYEDMCKARL